MGDKQYSSPPPYGFYPQAQATPMGQVIHTTTTPVMAMPVGPHSSQMICPSCNANISTRVELESTAKTHIIALILCICMMWPCAIIPYCCDCGKNSNHYCPNCKAFLGTYSA